MATPTAFQVPPLDQRKRIPARVIRALAKHIAEEFDPEEIILFGSHAYGKPQPWSDVDLLVVMETPKGELETALEISDALPRLAFKVDIVARSSKTIKRRIEIGDRFIAEITQKGKVLYARDH
ncbi:MAG: nucleotidyltransferase domain-containing protein [Anaerolineales bacterium]